MFYLSERLALTRKSSYLVPPKQFMLVLSNYPVTDSQPGGHKHYFRIRRHFYWLAIAVHCYEKVRNCAECAQIHINLPGNFYSLNILPAKSPLESFAIVIVGELIVTLRVQRYLLVIRYQFTMIFKGNPMNRLSISEVAKLFVYD